jgi:hypothetical protein
MVADLGTVHTIHTTHTTHATHITHIVGPTGTELEPWVMSGLLVLVIAFATLLVAALAGWAATVVGFARSVAETAKAWEIMERVESKIDSRVNEVVSIAKKRLIESRSAHEDTGPKGGTVLDDEAEALREAARRATRGPTRMFSGTPSDLPLTPEGIGIGLGMTGLGEMPMPGERVEG